jgi:hypothetical protein
LKATPQACFDGAQDEREILHISLCFPFALGGVEGRSAIFE